MPQERGFPSSSQKRGRSRSRSRSPPRKRPGATARTNRDRRPPPGPGRSRREERDPSPRRSPSRSPPRQLKRPGGAARISQAEREAARRRQEERERELERERQAAAAARGVGDVVKQHYNAVPERGREWRKTDSKIKGLRSFNNWVKSCIIQKFSPGDESTGESRYGQNILVLDIGCGKGGDLQKWQSAPRRVDLYVGVDPADVSIDQARSRYEQMKRKPYRGRPQHIFHAEFFAKDGYGEWLGDIPIIRDVGIDPSVGPDGGGAGRFGGGGFDVVTMMFCMHYAFESEHKARGMLRNVAGSLKKGGRFLGVIPNSDVLSAKVEEFHKKNGKGQAANGAGADGSDSPAFASDDDWDPEKPSEEPKEEAQPAEKEEDGEVKDESVEWGNSIYRVKFPGKTPTDGVFRPPFGWKYFYFLEEAVESVPEYVVPWEAFRALAEDYNLELQYRKPFNEVWDEENGDPILGPLSERMGVRGRDRGPLLIRDEEMEAASFYHAFCFYKV